MLPFLAMAAGSPIGGCSDIVTRRFGKSLGRGSIAGTGLFLAAIFMAC